MSEMIPFGTVKTVFCEIHGEVDHVLGGDDEWYCGHCDSVRYKSILAFYKPEDVCPKHGTPYRTQVDLLDVIKGICDDCINEEA